MRRRQAQAEKVSQLLEREPRPEGELDRHDEILRTIRGGVTRAVWPPRPRDVRERALLQPPEPW